MKPKNLKFFRCNFQAMGTPCDIQLFARSLNKAKQVADAVIEDVCRLEALYSRYRDDSLLSAINRVALAGGRITLDEETSGLLNYAATCYNESNGLFDITSGVLRKAWRFDRTQLPDKALIEDLLGKVGWDKLRWEAPVLEFPIAGMEIDFGGIVKEYAVDRAAALCAASGIRHGLINLGGDIKIIGPRADGSAWRIGISHPRKKNTVMKTLLLKKGALASSGDYERCIVVDDIRYSHVLNPKTGWPVRHLASVNVIGDFCVVAGSASTIAMLKEDAGPGWLTGMGLPHLWVDVNGAMGGSLEKN